MTTPWPLPPTTVKLVQRWEQMSRLVRYAIVTCAEEIVFLDGSVARRRLGTPAGWEVVRLNGHGCEALIFANKTLMQTADPFYAWRPSPAKVAQAMAELRKRRPA